MSCTHRGPLMSFRAFALCGCCNAPAQSESPFSGLNLAAGSANTEARPDGPPPGRSESQPRQQRQSQNGAGPRQQGQIAANAPASLPEGAIGDAAAARQSGGRGRCAWDCCVLIAGVCIGDSLSSGPVHYCLQAATSSVAVPLPVSHLDPWPLRQLEVMASVAQSLCEKQTN